MGEIFHRERELSKNSEQINGHTNLEELTNKKQVGYLKLHLLPSMQSEIIPLFEAYIIRSNEVV